jgi:hypothetical protein
LGLNAEDRWVLFRREAKLSLHWVLYAVKLKKETALPVTPPRGAGGVLRKALRFQPKPAVSRLALQNTSL